MEPEIKSFRSRDVDGLGRKINLGEKIDEDGKNLVKKSYYTIMIYIFFEFFYIRRIKQSLFTWYWVWGYINYLLFIYSIFLLFYGFLYGKDLKIIN